MDDKGENSSHTEDITKGNIASNYRPITCLPLMWKILTGKIAEKVHTSLEERELLPEEQKGCRRGSRGTNDLLFIDKKILREVKERGRAWLWVGASLLDLGKLTNV